MQNAIPRALTTPRADAAQCPACLSVNFQRHLPASSWRAERGETLIRCATCKQTYVAQFETEQRAA